MNRKPCRAGMFYPSTREECIQELKKYLSQDNIPEIQNLQAGIVPHAGWVYSGVTAGKMFQCVAKTTNPDTFIIFGAVHVPGVSKPSLWPDGAWETPLQVTDIDTDVVQWLHENASEYVVDNPAAHRQEHSIEVQIPFIQYAFPNSKIVPIATPPIKIAIALGEKLAEYKEKDIFVIGSTDMTHYGYRFGFAPAGRAFKAHDWVKEDNDKRMIDLIQDMKIENILPEAYNHNNACGGGAIAATLAFAKARGITKGTFLHYTTSLDVRPEPNADSLVGYSSFVF